jgi:phage baseplate assembly protein V
MSTLATLTRVEIKVDGAPLSMRAASAFEEVRVHRRLSQPSLCELVFFVPRDPISELYGLRVGSALQLSMPEINASLFSGEITAVEHAYEPSHGQTIRIRCYDLLHRMRKSQPVRVHVEVTPVELARELTADLGITVEAEDDGPLSRRLLQYRQSNLDLLVDVSRRCGLYLTLRDDVLHLLTLQGLGSSIPLELGKTLFEARLELNAEPACRSILVKGWDASRVEAHESRVDGPRIGRDVSAAAPPDRFHVTGEGTLADEAFPDDLHARAVAQAELDARVAREVTLWGVAEGNVDLQPGSRVEVSGIAGNFAGTYVLTSVDHRINRRTGFVSEISTLPPHFDKQPGGAIVVWGTITSVDDPEKMGRVRAWLPAIGKIETDWMGVMAAGAGGNKGFVILPDVDDEVLVLFIGGDPSQAVVLGGLYGARGPGDYGVEDSSIRRYSIGTSGGQKIKLDDAGQCIRLENKGGSFMEISPEKFFLHSAVPLEIEAPGCEVVITGKSIDFRQA